MPLNTSSFFDSLIDVLQKTEAELCFARKMALALKEYLERVPTRIDPEDLTCRSCQGQLEIVLADDSSEMDVQCLDCGDSYRVHSDDFGDAWKKYWTDEHRTFLVTKDDEIIYRPPPDPQA